MRLNNADLYQLFSEKEIHYLYHANTVGTSRTFIQNDGLLSRGAIEAKGLFQTPQGSDALDKQFNVWNDVFLDTVDLHGYFPRQNLYGPVSFRVSSGFLLEQDYHVWVTKDNPQNWNANMTDAQKYFSDVAELRRDWDLYHRQRKMVTIRNQLEPVLFNYVDEVQVDDPEVILDGTTVLFNEAVDIFKGVLVDKPLLKGKFRKRVCENCFCKSNYIDQVRIHDLKRLFLV